MNSSRGNIEFYPRRRDFVILLVILSIFSYLLFMDYLYPTVMANGKLYEHAYVDGAMAVFLFIPIPYVILKLISNKTPTLSLTPHGIKDTRLYNQLIPWQEVENVDLIITSWFDSTPSFIRIEVSKEFSTELVASTLLNKINQYFVTHTNDGTVKLTILRPWLLQDIRELYDIISDYRTEYNIAKINFDYLP